MSGLAQAGRQGGLKRKKQHSLCVISRYFTYIIMSIVGPHYNRYGVDSTVSKTFPQKILKFGQTKLLPSRFI